ncbi:MAG TPA: biopolymer transporter ExbD [Salinimicrobium sp.]|nr:biopolymer transporter ExbD [Salinimicrobium sp.]
MSKFRKKKNEGTPEISTASLPDIVFMLLFFFMVATTMRETTLKVDNDLPFADQVEKLEKKELVMYIYIGKPSPRYQDVAGTQAVVQLNDNIADVSEIQQFIYAEREAKREELVPFLTTALKVDSETNMGIVSDVKQELREANALKINYSTRTGDISRNME